MNRDCKTNREKNKWHLLPKVQQRVGYFIDVVLKSIL